MTTYEHEAVPALEFKFSSHSDCCDFSRAMCDPVDLDEDERIEDWGLSIVDIYDPAHVFDEGIENERIPMHEMCRHDEKYEDCSKLWISPCEGVWEFWCKAIKQKAEQFGPVEIKECMFDFDEEEFERYV